MTIDRISLGMVCPEWRTEPHVMGALWPSLPAYPFLFPCFYLSSFVFISRTQCYCVLRMQVLKRTIKYKEKKRNILNKDKFKTPNSLKFQIVFPHLKSISRKWVATGDSGISLSVLLITGLLSFFKLPDFHLGSYELYPQLLPKLILSLHLKHYPLLLWGRWNIYLSKCPGWIKAK